MPGDSDPFAIGRRHGGFVVLEHVVVSDDPVWAGYDNYTMCRCDCGAVVKVCDRNLVTNGLTKRCRECTKWGIRFPHHARRDRLLYKIWERMVWRCHLVTPDEDSDSARSCYRNYRGRGITVCDEWRDNFPAFRDWALSHGYAEGLSIDRIDNDGNYCPENCRWVTMAEQQKNKRPRCQDTRPRRPYVKRRKPALAAGIAEEAVN